MTTNTVKQVSADRQPTTGNVYVAYSVSGTSGSLKMAKWNSGGSVLGFESADTTLSHSLPSISLTSDGNVHIYTLANSKVYETKKTTGWLAPALPFGSTFASPDQLTSTKLYAATLWEECSSAPYAVMFGPGTGASICATNTLRWDSGGEQRVSYFDGMLEWEFYYDGSNIVYRYSNDNGVTWSSTSSTPSGILAANSFIGVYGEGNTVIVAASSPNLVYTLKGTISGTIISWGGRVSVGGPVGTNSGQQFLPSFEKMGTALFLGYNVVTDGTNNGYVVSSPDLGNSWTYAASLHSAEANPAPVGLARTSATTLIAIYAKYGDSQFRYKTYDGTSWSAEALTSGAGLTASASKTAAMSITSDGTCAWLLYVRSNAGGPLDREKICYSAGVTTFTFLQLDAGTSIYPSVGAINGNINGMYVQGGVILAATNINTGYGTVTQLGQQPFGTSFSTPAYIHVEKYGTSPGLHPQFRTAWQEGPIPYTPKFGVMQLCIPM